MLRLCPKGVAPESIGREEIRPTEKCLSKLLKSKGWEAPPLFLEILSPRIGRTLETPAGGLKAPEVLERNNLFILTAVRTDMGRIWVSCRCLHLLELKIKKFGCLALR